MDPALVNDSSSSAVNSSAYSLPEIWPFSREPGGSGFGLRMANFRDTLDGSVDESTLTDQSGGAGAGGRKRPAMSSDNESSKIMSTTSNANDLSGTNGKRIKTLKTRDIDVGSKAEVEMSSVVGNKPPEQGNKPAEPPKQDYIHVRARRGQATDSHSLAERARREKISERMKILQDLVPGCNKVIGKALVLDEIINYIQSLQHQVEFLSMKLEAVNSRMSMHSSLERFPSKDIAMHSFDATGLIYGSQARREYAQGSQPEWLQGRFERAT